MTPPRFGTALPDPSTGNILYTPSTIPASQTDTFTYQVRDTLNLVSNVATVTLSPVGDVIKQGLPWTVGLVGMATIIAVVLGTLLGMLSAWRRGGFLDAVLPPVFIVISAYRTWKK